MADCIFCKIIDGKVPSEKVAETERTISILDIHPVTPGHALVIPKVHYEQLTDLPEEILTEATREAQRLARAVIKATGADGFNLLQNNHACAGQAIPHVHLHIIPRKTEDGVKYNWSPKDYAEGEIGSLAGKIKESLQ